MMPLETEESGFSIKYSIAVSTLKVEPGGYSPCVARFTRADSSLESLISSGLYPPGSTFKVLTAMEYLIENPDSYSKFRYECKGISESFDRENLLLLYSKSTGRLLLNINRSVSFRNCAGS